MRVIDAAMGAAWAMEESALRQLLLIAHREHEITPQALEAYRSAAMEKGERARVRDGVAILNAEGPLFKRANMMTEFSGATSYDVLLRDFTAAVDDGNIKAIVWNIDSPGGEVSGCAELAAAIAAARGKKPIVAYAGDLVASAAYWLASACDRVVVGASAAVGSIGVRASITDTSARDARAGLQRFEFVSSQSPYKVSDPKSEDGAARLQARVDALAAVFVETVAANRDVASTHVLDAFGKGDVLIGPAAVAAGMADAIGTFESVIAALVSSSEPLASIGFSPAALRGSPYRDNATMPTVEEINAAVEAARQDAAAAATAAAAAEHEAIVATATAEAATTAQAAERARVAGLYAATIAGYEAARDEAIQSGSSIDAFKGLIVDKEHAKAAERAQAVTTDTKANESVRVGAEATVVTETADDKAYGAIMRAMALAKGK